MEPVTYIFTHRQISDLDTTGFMDLFGLSEISPTELRGLCGAVRIRVEGVTQLEQIFAENGPRLFFQKLCSEWPAGYFLRLGRLTSSTNTESILDAGMFVSLGLCHSSLALAQWDNLGVSGMSFKTDQFSDWMERCSQNAAEVAKNAGLSSTAIERRRWLIAATVRSFFALGTPPPKKQ
jgi:hypothetical protein